MKPIFQPVINLAEACNEIRKQISSQILNDSNWPIKFFEYQKLVNSIRIIDTDETN